jgi:hypothetical protein
MAECINVEAWTVKAGTCEAVRYLSKSCTSYQSTPVTGASDYAQCAANHMLCIARVYRDRERWSEHLPRCVSCVVCAYCEVGLGVMCSGCRLELFPIAVVFLTCAYFHALRGTLRKSNVSGVRVAQTYLYQNKGFVCAISCGCLHCSVCPHFTYSYPAMDSNQFRDAAKSAIDESRFHVHTRLGNEAGG